MKKILTMAVIIVAALQVNAQQLSLNYTHHFKELKDEFIQNKLVVAQPVEQISLQYVQSFKSSPVKIRLSASKGRLKPPLPLILKSSPYTYLGKFAADNNFEADSARFSSSKQSGATLMAGVGYILPHKANSKITFVANFDAGLLITKSNTLNFYYNKNLTHQIGYKKTQFIWSPSVQANYSFTPKVGLGLGVGYSNLGGINTTAGLFIRFIKPNKDCPHIQCCGTCEGPFPKRDKQF